MSRTVEQREVGYGDLTLLHLSVGIAWTELALYPDQRARIIAGLKAEVRALHDAYVREVALSRSKVQIAEQAAARWEARYWQYQDDVLAQWQRTANNWIYERLADRFDPSGYFVYLLWGESDDVPIYVGQSINVCHRVGSHFANRVYGWRIRSVSLIRLPSDREMMRTERRLIAQYQPELNRDGKPRIDDGGAVAA